MNTSSNREFKEEEETILGDFFADLFHYCRLNDLNLYDYLDSGWMHFSAETTPDKEDEDDSERTAGADMEPCSEPAPSVVDHEAEIEQIIHDIAHTFCRSRKREC